MIENLMDNKENINELQGQELTEHLNDFQNNLIDNQVTEQINDQQPEQVNDQQTEQAAGKDLTFLGNAKVNEAKRRLANAHEIGSGVESAKRRLAEAMAEEEAEKMK